MKAKLLMSERLLVCQPSLARALGSHTLAIVLQQVHYLSERRQTSVERDGHLWVSLSQAEWADEVCLSRDQVYRVFKRLADAGLIVCGSDGAGSKGLVRVDYDAVDALVDTPLADTEPDDNLRGIAQVPARNRATTCADSRRSSSLIEGEERERLQKQPQQPSDAPLHERMEAAADHPIQGPTARSLHDAINLARAEAGMSVQRQPKPGTAGHDWLVAMAPRFADVIDVLSRVAEFRSDLGTPSWLLKSLSSPWGAFSESGDLHYDAAVRWLLTADDTPVAPPSRQWGDDVEPLL